MDLGMIGLGRMGASMARRLLLGGHRVVGYARHAGSVAAVAADGVVAAYDLPALVEALAPPRVVWIMVPAAAVDGVLDALVPLLAPGDTVIDGGNSWYLDDQRRSADLAALGLRYLDVGTSGGVWGFERGYCLMIGGDAAAVDELAPLLDTLAPGHAAAPRSRNRRGEIAPEERGWLHCGEAGAGHFVKMVHNGIEYGLMAAYAEGLNVLRHAGIGRADRPVDAETAPLRNPSAYSYDFDIAAVTELWRRGSVVASWLLDLTADALYADRSLSDFSGHVSDSGEGRWTVQAAVEEGVPVPVLATALFSRFSSRGNDDYANRVLSAMRREFGGHDERGAPA